MKINVYLFEFRSISRRSSYCIQTAGRLYLPICFFKEVSSKVCFNQKCTNYTSKPMKIKKNKR